MSWKGFTKAVTRLPHQVLAKTGYSEDTKDPEFLGFEKHFTELEKVTDHLLEDSQKYRDAVSAMLNHQATFGELLVELYSSTMGQQSTDVDGGAVVVKRTPQTPHDAAQAVGDFAAFMSDTRDLLFPELVGCAWAKQCEERRGAERVGTRECTQSREFHEGSLGNEAHSTDS
ncbi:hypothetical protein BC936DRAFT_143551 [Jimgerdemannia flammicorona]|uniref:BAR domain-containing protein n=1 Tax=Jimgerdemannia flammicorona TaxID=994334 RepID=A0A432ZYQ8_9FUNG|nr:hypothetical protein BC936DRAFT_143551 [Jimgerdemannia flammicorona]